MTSLLDKDKSCEPPVEKKCKEPALKAIEIEEKKKAEKEPECVEPQPPEVRDKVLFDPNSPDPINRERAKCLEDCKVEPIYTLWKACDRRVTKKLLYTAETCHEETIDLMEALDKCVRDTGFLQLE
ncbi:hypothetical protein PYW08_009781 [Mythimna loreyi]|uniref:Uncharacterized protein n=1 Tax=Mythimna loreyi TaxID=667449 RepID=A0ACC2Q721_9NEOP|nr:hypothetical protein PYW08_009781 [Mythimna loreyi]